MWAAVPKELSNFDLVGTTDRRLRRYEPGIVRAFFELPLLWRYSGVGLSQHDCLLISRWLRCGFFDDFQYFFLDDFLLFIGRLDDRFCNNSGLFDHGLRRLLFAACDQEDQERANPD